MRDPETLGFLLADVNACDALCPDVSPLERRIWRLAYLRGVAHAIWCRNASR